MVDLCRHFSKAYSSFIICFGSVEDPRVSALVTYQFEEILFATLCGVIAGCDDFEEVVLFSNDHLTYLRRYFPYTNGFPKEQCLIKLFSRIDGDNFERCFNKWLSKTINHIKGVIAIDGKTIRGSGHKDRKALHIVSAFIQEQGLILGQRKVNDKSNEITAIPELLDNIDVKGTIVTLDAMGCQKKIAAKIIEKEADYVLALKNNHGSLYDDVTRFFARHEALNFSNRGYVFEIDKITDADHGRIESRKIVMLSDVSWLTFDHPQWSNFKSIIMIDSTRMHKNKDTRGSSEKRYYISSLDCDAKKAAKAIRAHWSVENNLHWVMDVTFNEDKCTTRKDNAPLNFAIIKRVAFNMLKMNTTKMSLKNKRKKASWDPDFLTKILIN